MAIALKSVDALQEHLRSVLEHADRQAGGINEVLLALVGGILWRKNPGEPVRVGDKSGAGGNIIWFRIGAQRYALLYKYKAGRIELMLDSRHGHVLHAFTNATPLADVVRVFSTLGLNDEAAQVPAPPMPAASTPAEPVPEVVESTAVEPAAAVEPPTPAVAVDAVAPRTATRRARTPATTAKAEQVEVIEPATKAPRARRSGKADAPPPPGAGQLPLVGVADAAPKPATARKRRPKVKATPETDGAAASPVAPASESAVAETKPRARSRSKSALQPA